MKLKFTSILLTAAFLLLAIGNINAQSPSFWSEDFSIGDIPSGWTSADETNQGALFTWCSDPLTGASGGCPNLFDGDPNYQSSFNSATSNNGFVTFDADGLGPLTTPYIAQLTTAPIDCSAESSVWLRFETHIGVWEYHADVNAIIRVSTDGTNWTDFTAFPNLTQSGMEGNDPGVARWSLNPEVVIVDISSVAASSSTVYVQWQWTGNWEYHWSIDDVTLHADNPTLAADMRVNTDWYAVAPYAITPASQVESFGFIADIQNIGSEEQTNVNLNISIVDGANVVYNNDLNYGTIGADSLAENVFFADPEFTPDGSITTYTGTYSVTADATDLDPTNNNRTFEFEVSDSTFAKERGITRTVRPADASWAAGESHSWRYGNHFHVVNGDDWYGSKVSFGIGNPVDAAGQSLTVFLYQWSDDGDGQCQEGERDFVAFNSYEITGFETANTFIEIDLVNFNDPTAPVPLTSGTDYVVMIEYTAPDANTDFELSASEDYDYGAQIFRSDSLEQPRFAGLLAIGDETEFGSTGFGWDIVPAVRFHITDELPVPEAIDFLDEANAVTLFPSPASEQITLGLDFVENMDNVHVKIIDMTGKVIQQTTYSDVMQAQYQYDVRNLSNGLYLLQVVTPQGNRTERFVVQK